MKPETVLIRECINVWLTDNLNVDTFTVTDICESLIASQTDIEGLNLCKSVSNELTRLHKVGIVEITEGVKRGCKGRPPKVYKRSYCTFSLSVMSANDFVQGL